MAEGTIADLTGNIPISLWEDNRVNYHSRSLQDNKHSCALLEWCKEVNYKSKFRHLCHSRWEAQKHNYGRAFRSSTKGWIDSSNSLHKNCREGSAIPSLHTLFQKAFANHSQFASDRNVTDANTLWFFPTAIKEFLFIFPCKDKMKVTSSSLRSSRRWRQLFQESEKCWKSNWQNNCCY